MLALLLCARCHGNYPAASLRTVSIAISIEVHSQGGSDGSVTLISAAVPLHTCHEGNDRSEWLPVVTNQHKEEIGERIVFTANHVLQSKVVWKLPLSDVTEISHAGSINRPYAELLSSVENSYVFVVFTKEIDSVDAVFDVDARDQRIVFRFW
jgi:hypothetical protein